MSCTNPAVLSPDFSTSPHRRLRFPLLSKADAEPATSVRSPASTSPLHLELVPVTSPVMALPLPACTTPVQLTYTSLVQAFVSNPQSIWASSPSVDSHTLKQMFGPGSSCSSDSEDDAAWPTPRPSRACKAGSSLTSSGKHSQMSFEPFRPSSSINDGAPSPKSTAVTKGGSRHSSSDEDSPPSSALWALLEGTPASSPAAVLASPSSVKARQAGGMTRFLRWRYRRGSLTSMHSDESDSSPEQLLTPPSDKPLSRQRIPEDNWGHHHSSCSRDDTGSDVSAVSGGTIRSGATRSPAATAMLSSPALSTAPESSGLQHDSACSVGELDIGAFTDLDSPVSNASVKLQSPGPGSATSAAACRHVGSPATAATAASMANSSGSDRRHSRGSTSSSAIGRPSLSGSKSRRPSWSMAGPTSPAVGVTPVQLAPTLARAAPVTRASTCRATALPSIAEARGSSVQADRRALCTSSAAGQPVEGNAPGSRPAANSSLRSAAVPAPAPAVMTRRQAAAAAAAAAAVQSEAKPASGAGAALIKVPRQARRLKPEAPTRRQPQRAAKPRWR